MVFSPQLLLTEKSQVTIGLDASEAERRLLALRASRMAAMLENHGYNHYGINE